MAGTELQMSIFRDLLPEHREGTRYLTSDSFSAALVGRHTNQHHPLFLNPAPEWHCLRKFRFVSGRGDSD